MESVKLGITWYADITTPPTPEKYHTNTDTSTGKNTQLTPLTTDSMRGDRLKDTASLLAAGDQFTTSIVFGKKM